MTETCFGAVLLSVHLTIMACREISRWTAYTETYSVGYSRAKVAVNKVARMISLLKAYIVVWSK